MTDADDVKQAIATLRRDLSRLIVIAMISLTAIDLVIFWLFL